MTGPPQRPAVGHAWRPDGAWAWPTVGAALLVTALDAVLLQLRRDYFTGGFLSTDAATAWIDRLGFVAGSIATDAVLVGLLVLVALAAANVLRLPPVARLAVLLAAGAGPLLVASLVEYRVFAQLGDAFDFFLMFDLVGQRPGEILAVASEHLLAPLLALVAIWQAVV
ncbi:MAG: hypothetical protein ACLGHP_11530, partial [Vicinamibacteria bacterium]